MIGCCSEVVRSRCCSCYHDGDTLCEETLGRSFDCGKVAFQEFVENGRMNIVSLDFVLAIGNRIIKTILDILSCSHPLHLTFGEYTDLGEGNRMCHLELESEEP